VTIIEKERLAFAFSGSGALTESDQPGFSIDVLHAYKLKSTAERIGSGGRAPIHAANATELDSGGTHATSPRSSATSA
jgi:hypothetical protein